MNYRQNYKQKQEQEKAALAALGLVSDHYTSVAKIEFRMTYYGKGSSVALMTRSLVFSPSDYAGFHVRCVEEGCTGGGFDLAPIVAGLTKARKTTTKGKAFCHGKNHAVGHACLAYEVSIRYQRKSS
ncbi:MAG: hypothetical protein OEW15_09250 [Nitrospirota bacterium]|nr:hypothetical protein [Nitrospirota bacterium]